MSTELPSVAAKTPDQERSATSDEQDLHTEHSTEDPRPARKRTRLAAAEADDAEEPQAYAAAEPQATGVELGIGDGDSNSEATQPPNIPGTPLEQRTDTHSRLGSAQLGGAPPEAFAAVEYETLAWHEMVEESQARCDAAVSLTEETLKHHLGKLGKKNEDLSRVGSTIADRLSPRKNMNTHDDVVSSMVAGVAGVADGMVQDGGGVSSMVRCCRVFDGGDPQASFGQVGQEKRGLVESGRYHCRQVVAEEEHENL